MRNISKKTLVLALGMFFTFTQAVDAIVENDPADKISKAAWTINQEVKLTKAEEITKTAWSYMAEEEKTLVALNQNNKTAFAADLESDDPTDTITKAIWMK